jgi:hypothetical protein
MFTQRLQILSNLSESTPIVTIYGCRDQLKCSYGDDCSRHHYEHLYMPGCTDFLAECDKFGLLVSQTRQFARNVDPRCQITCVED